MMRDRTFRFERFDARGSHLAGRYARIAASRTHLCHQIHLAEVGAVAVHAPLGRVQQVGQETLVVHGGERDQRAVRQTALVMHADVVQLQAALLKDLSDLGERLVTQLALIEQTAELEHRVAHHINRRGSFSGNP